MGIKWKSKKERFWRRRAEGIAEGEKQGFLKGAEQKAIETAKNFLKLGLSIEQVANGTRLSLEVVKKLKEEL